MLNLSFKGNLSDVLSVGVENQKIPTLLGINIEVASFEEFVIPSWTTPFSLYRNLFQKINQHQL